MKSTTNEYGTHVGDTIHVPGKTKMPTETRSTLRSATALEPKESATKRPRLSRTVQSDDSSPPPSMTVVDGLTTLRSSSTTPPATPPPPLPIPQKKNHNQRKSIDPLNIAIYEFRKEGLDWEGVAKRTNVECGLTGDYELAPTSCYSRFVRNAPAVAKSKGEEYKKEWYIGVKAGGTTPASAPAPTQRQSQRKRGRGPEEDESSEDEEVDNVVENTVLGEVKRFRSQFWMNITLAVNDKLEGKPMSESEVKAVYDRVNQT